MSVCLCVCVCACACVRTCVRCAYINTCAYMNVYVYILYVRTYYACLCFPTKSIKNVEIVLIIIIIVHSVAKRVATRSEFHVEDCILKTSLSQRRPDPLDHILQLWNPDNTIVLTAIPESVCNEHLEAHIDAETGLRAEEHYKLRKRRDSLALVVLPPHYSGMYVYVLYSRKVYSN